MPGWGSDRYQIPQKYSKDTYQIYIQTIHALEMRHGRGVYVVVLCVCFDKTKDVSLHLTYSYSSYMGRKQLPL
jgi:hypothetical protein